MPGETPGLRKGIACLNYATGVFRTSRGCADEYVYFELGASTMKKTSIRLACLLATFVVASVVVTGCNTIEGAGKDIKSGGRAIENAASDAK